MVNFAEKIKVTAAKRNISWVSVYMPVSGGFFYTIEKQTQYGNISDPGRVQQEDGGAVAA